MKNILILLLLPLFILDCKIEAELNTKENAEEQNKRIVINKEDCHQGFGYSYIFMDKLTEKCYLIFNGNGTTDPIEVPCQ